MNLLSEKVRENRLRRVAERRGYRLMKSRRRDPKAVDYGVFWLIRKADEHLTLCSDLDDVEKALERLS